MRNNQEHKHNPVSRWKIIQENLSSFHGGTVWEIDKWETHKGKLELCKSGYHCSGSILDALTQFKPGVIASVKVKGDSITSDNKEVWRCMMIESLWQPYNDDYIDLAIYAIKLVFHLYEPYFDHDITESLFCNIIQYQENPYNRITISREISKNMLETDIFTLMLANSSWAGLCMGTKTVSKSPLSRRYNIASAILNAGAMIIKDNKNLIHSSLISALNYVIGVGSLHGNQISEADLKNKIEEWLMNKFYQRKITK